MEQEVIGYIFNQLITTNLVGEFWEGELVITQSRLNKSNKEEAWENKNVKFTRKGRYLSEVLSDLLLTSQYYLKKVGGDLFIEGGNDVKANGIEAT